MAIRISGLNSGLDTDSIVKELVSAYSTKKDKYVKAQTKLSWKQDAWKEMNSKIYNFYSKSLSSMKFGGLANFTSKKLTTVSDSAKATVSAGSGVVNGTQTLKVNRLATPGYLTGSKLSSSGEVTSSTKMSALGVNSGILKMEVGGEEKSISVNSNMTVSEFVSALKEQGVTANFDATQQRFFIGSSESGEDNDFNFIANNENSLKMLRGLGLATEADYKSVYGSDYDTRDLVLATKSDASNAIIELNGALFESGSNTFSINGLNITATGVSDLMTITTQTDVDGIYNMIKDFLKEYNSLINSMEAAYKATSAKGYEPLTEDEKSEMSDTEIEKWESKIKDSLLRKDETLSSVMSAMSAAMSKVYQVNDKKYSLSSFGIKTAGYFVSAENESYAYHIDGDSDDSVSGTNSDKLRAAIETDLDAVAGFFTQFADGLYESLDKKMKSTELSSAYSVYNDKLMKNEYNDYTKTIKKWEEKLKDLEDRYYKQFSAMETALSKLQSQTSSLTSLLGG